MSPYGVTRPPLINQDNHGWTGGDGDNHLGEGINQETAKSVIQNIDVEKICGNDAWNQWGNLCFKEIYHIELH